MSETKQKKDKRSPTTINPSGLQWKRFKMVALERDVTLAKAVDDAIGLWIQSTTAPVVATQVLQGELATASPVELRMLLEVLRAFRRAGK